MNSGKTAFLILNGEPPENLNIAKEYDFICAADGAYMALKKEGIQPDLIVGDFDSIQSVPNNINRLYTPNQEYTDFEKALKVLYDKGFENIHVFGASGQQQDHFLGNLHAALVWKDKVRLTFFDAYGSYQFIEHSFEANHMYQKTVSLYPFPKATEINTKGLQYPLTGETLALGTRIGIRNKAVEDEISITYKDGELLLFISYS